MNDFKLPDLGEGLPDAEIHEWYVKEGDTVKADQPLVSMETAKAVVEVPSPQDGIIAKLYGKPGDVIQTGDPLLAFAHSEATRKDEGTVVGNLEQNVQLGDDHFTIGSAGDHSNRVKATPAVKILAKKLNVNIKTVSGSGEHGLITRADVEKAAALQQQIPEGFEPLRGVRRAMLSSMTQSHAQVVPVSIFDEADISAWDADQDITVRLIRAIVAACIKEPALNAWFDTQHSARKCFDQVHLGLAMDSDEGLFVPVIHNASSKSDTALREQINSMKKAVKNRELPAEKLKGATITLSNFGKFAGRFASPIIVPPSVAILAVGRLYQAAVVDGKNLASHPVLPLSLSFDHRAVTGGEATRFLGTVIDALQQAQ
ncbi:MAG: 2-oxo acid dehydrogenase subunit E2 [Legionellaceae bacterium]|nr:2-oxo acid dehydrogenase subunit E2 [Legionellaceae bacterium]